MIHEVEPLDTRGWWCAMHTMYRLRVNFALLMFLTLATKNNLICVNLGEQMHER